MKYYAWQNNERVELGGCRDSQTIPEGSVELTKEVYEAAKIIGPFDRKLSGNTVVKKSKEELDVTRLKAEEAVTRWKIGRRSYRLTRLPFEWNGKKIKLEDGNLRNTPYGAFMTWENFIRDAVLCELTGNSKLPFSVMDNTESKCLVDTQAKLYALHAAMTEFNKAALQEECNLRESLKTKTKVSDIKEIRALNRQRTRDIVP